MPDNTQDQSQIKSKSITIGIFFDGTLNNRYDVAARNIVAGHPENSYEQDDANMGKGFTTLDNEYHPLSP